MGTFDSYYLPWAKGSVEVQTKQYYESMCGWRLGDMVDVRAFEHGAPTSAHFVLEEDFSLSYSAPDTIVHLHHWEGLFCDFVTAPTSSQAHEASAQLKALWAHPMWRLEAQFRFLDNAKRQAGHQGHLNHLQRTLLASWESYQDDQKNPGMTDRQKAISQFFRRNFDFESKTVEVYWKEILNQHSAYHQNPDQPWPLQAELEIQNKALAAAPPQSRWGVQEDSSRTRYALMFNPTKDDPLAALSKAFDQARIDHVIEIYALKPSLLDDPKARELTEHWLSHLLCSRLFCHDAMKLMCETRIVPSTVLTQEPIPLLSWLTSCMGVYPGAMEALILAKPSLNNIGSLEALLAHEDYASLFKKEIEHLTPDQLMNTTLSDGTPLVLFTLKETLNMAFKNMLSQGLDPNLLVQGRSLLDHALDLPDRGNMNKRLDFFPDGTRIEAPLFSPKNHLILQLLHAGATESADFKQRMPASLSAAYAEFEHLQIQRSLEGHLDLRKIEPQEALESSPKASLEGTSSHPPESLETSSDSTTTSSTLRIKKRL